MGNQQQVNVYSSNKGQTHVFVIQDIFIVDADGVLVFFDGKGEAANNYRLVSSDLCFRLV